MPLCFFFVYSYVCSPISYWLWWSLFEHDGSRLWPISSPRYFAWSTASKIWPCRTYWVWMGFRALEICTTWLLLGLKCISQVFSHCSSFCRSCCKVWESFLLVTVKYTVVSSANSLTWELIFSGRSLMYNRNKIVPRTELWGTPDVTGISDDFPLQEPHTVNARVRMP